MAVAGYVLHGIPRADGSPAEGVHLLWNGPAAWGYSEDGYTLLRRSARETGLRRCEIIEGSHLQRLQTEHILATPIATYRYREVPCPEPVGEEGVQFRGHCFRYRIDLHQPEPIVRVEISNGPLLAVAYREGKAIDARVMEDAPASALFTHPGIERVDVHCQEIKSLEVCVLHDRQRDDLDDWSEAEVIARLQIPLGDYDPSLADETAELAEARARMVDPSTLTDPEFANLATILHELRQVQRGRPVDGILLVRQRADQGFQQYGLLDLGLLPRIDPDGRRMLGFAFIDRDVSLGEVYDYRVIGSFREIDLVDRVLGFERVPIGTTLPAVFFLGDTHVRWAGVVRVTSRPRAGAGVDRAVVRKGISMAPGRGSESVAFEFAVPVDEVTVEVEPDNTLDLGWDAFTPGFLPWLPPTFSGQLPNDPQAVLTFPSPIDRLVLRGRGFLYAVRLHGVTGGARDPDRFVEAWRDVWNVPFVATPPPDPPLTVGVENLQAPLVPTPAAQSVAAPAPALGFHVRWQPPISGGATAWSPASDQPPPVDSAGFRIERREAGAAGTWEPVGPPLVLGSRATSTANTAITTGTDIAAFFSEKGRTAGAATEFVFDDILDAARPGTTWRHRVLTVDATGRESAWTESADIRLEKRRPPPPPVAPVSPPPLGGGELGMEARVLDRLDPDATPADLALLGAHQNGVVLRWGWTDHERQTDPWAVHFRVYLQPNPADVLHGVVTAPIADIGSAWRFTAQIDRTLTAGALAGLRITSGGRSFRITSHGAGDVVQMEVGKLAVDPAVAPATGPFRLIVDLAGAEARPASFAAREAVVPIQTGQDTYQVVLTDVFSPTATMPVQTIWVGVSTADAQLYVPDQLPSSQPNGGLPGNESQIMTRAVSIRYRGRPVLTGPALLPDVPERVTDEPGEGPVRVHLPLAGLVRPVTPPIVAGESVQLERLPAHAITGRLRPASTGVDITLPDGSTANYTPAHPADQQALTAEVASGDPARVEGKFLLALLGARPTLTSLFAPTGGPRPFGTLDDDLPPAAERYLYRIRRVDAAGHLSEGAAVVDTIVRVPSLRVPGPPDLSLGPSTDDKVRVAARVRPAFDVGWVLVFIADGPAGTTPPEGRAELIRLANRRDLYPNDGIRLRAPDGTTLQPIGVELAAGVPDPQSELVRVDVESAIGFERRADVWAVTLSRDGIPSPPAGPTVARTALPPLGPPWLAVTRIGAAARLEWDPAAVPTAEVRPERREAGSPWTAVGPWLPPGTSAWEEPAPADATEYRIQLRTRDGRQATGAAVPLPGA